MALLRTAAALPAVLALALLLAPPPARAAFPLDSVPGGRDLLQAPPTCWDQTNTDCTTTSLTQCGACNPLGGVCTNPTGCGLCGSCYGGNYTGACAACEPCDMCAQCLTEVCNPCKLDCDDGPDGPECIKTCEDIDPKTCDDLDTMFGPNGCAATCTDADKAAVKAMLAGDDDEEDDEDDEDSPGREAVEGYCEGRGYTELTCPPTCCQWDNGQCWADKDDISDCTADNEADWGNDSDKESDIMSPGDKRRLLEQHDENLAACAVFATPTPTAAASNTTTAPAPTSAAARTFTLAAALAAALALAGLAF